MRQRYQILTVICNIDILLLYDYLQSDVTATMTAQQKLRGNHHAKGNIHSPALIKCHCHVSRNPICNIHMTCPPLTVKGCRRLQKHKTNFTCIICIMLQIGCLYCNWWSAIRVHFFFKEWYFSSRQRQTVWHLGSAAWLH